MSGTASSPLSAVLALGLLPLIAVAAADETSSIHESIDRGNALYIEAMGRADARAFATVYDADGARFSSDGSVTRGRDAIEKQVTEFLGRVGPVEVTIETVRLWVVDNLAYETGKWTYTYDNEGDRRVIGGLFVTIWKRQTDGEWKILRDMGVPGTDLEDARKD